MHRQRIGMSQFLLLLLLVIILSSLVIATSANIIPEVPDLSANVIPPGVIPPHQPLPDLPPPKLPELPPIPKLPDLPPPKLPELPPIPKLPDLPPIPKLPDLPPPKLPDLPPPKLPDLLPKVPDGPPKLHDLLPKMPDGPPKLPDFPPPSKIDLPLNIPNPLMPKAPPVDPTAPTPSEDPNMNVGDLAREFLHLHNKARRHAKLPPFMWDPKLEEYAKQYAAQRANSDCELVHSMGPYGENLFWGGGPNWKPKDAVKGWIKEHKYYNQLSNECKDGKICGHYTQVVWRDTTHIGCAVERCKNNDTFTICSYDPPGNYLGEKPYIHYEH